MRTAATLVAATTVRRVRQVPVLRAPVTTHSLRLRACPVREPRAMPKLALVDPVPVDPAPQPALAAPVRVLLVRLALPAPVDLAPQVALRVPAVPVPLPA